MLRRATRSGGISRSREKRRMLNIGPSTAKRRNDGVDPRPIDQPGVYHRRGLVDAASDLRTILSMMRIRCGSSRKVTRDSSKSAPLDVDRLVAVHQNVGNSRVLEQGLERPQPEHLVQNLVANLLLLDGAQQRRLALHERDQRLAHFAANPLVVDGGQRLQVDLVEQLAVQREFQLLSTPVSARPSASPRCAGAAAPSSSRARCRNLCSHASWLSNAPLPAPPRGLSRAPWAAPARAAGARPRPNP